MRARVLGSLGALLTLGAGAVLVDPSLADHLSAVVSFVESREPERLLLVLGGVVGSYATWLARSRSSARPPADGPEARFAGVGDPPETVTASDRARTGESFDARVEAACAGDDEALRAVREDLRETAASARARAAGAPVSEARTAVESGAWTDDRIAAAFLAGEGGPQFPLAARLRAWLDPETERRRRVDRTVAEVRRAFDGDGDGEAGTPDAADHREVSGR